MSKQNNIPNYIFKNVQIFAVNDSQMLLQNAIGSNSKGLLVVANTPRPELITLLEKILKAVHHDLSHDALLLNIQKPTPLSFVDLCRKSDSSITKAIFFGQSPASVGLNINATLYQYITLDQYQILFVDDLARIHDDQQLKQKLWKSLQEMFSVG